MTNKQRANLMPVLLLAFDSGVERLVAEVLALEGYQVRRIHTDAEACSLLDADVGTYIVLMDNLQVHHEGWQFLMRVRQDPSLRARVKTVSMAAIVNNEWLRRDFGDALDAFLDLPFTLDQLLDTLEDTLEPL